MNSSLVRSTFRVLVATALAAGAVVGSTGTAFATDHAGATHLSPALPRLAPAATRIDQAGIATILAKHNSARDEVKVPHLSWDSGLAADGQVYAAKLAAQDSRGPAHDKAELTRLNQGENLAWSQGTPPLEFAVNFWYSERAAYLAEPNKTTYQNNPRLQTFGHYTQMVWFSTTKVGCGMATSATGKTYVSCRYSPPGNLDGQLAFPGAATSVIQPNLPLHGPCKPGFVWWRQGDSGAGPCINPAVREQARRYKIAVQ